MKQPKNNISSQLDKANQVLQDMSHNITASDRDAAKDSGVVKSQTTVSTYLNGGGKDLDVAMSLIQFFKNRIEEREEILKELAAA